jgi:hypothetical protein
MRWTDEYNKHLLAFREQFPDSSSDVARAMSLWFETPFTKDQVQKQVLRLTRKATLGEQPTVPYMPTFRKYFDGDGQSYTRPTRRPLGAVLSTLQDKSGRVQLLHLSDLHVDQHDATKIDAVLRRHSGADLVVVGGDALDIYAYSRFAKDRNIPVEREIEAWMGLQEFLAREFPAVVIIDSNHLQRVGAALAGIPAGLGFLVETNLHRHLAQPFANVYVVDSWLLQIEDACFSHGDFARTRAPKAAEKVHEKIARFRAAGQLVINGIVYPQDRPHRVLVQAHTHQVGSTVVNGVKLIESGCLAKLPLDYTVSSRSIPFTTPQVNGYAMVVQRHGRSVLNESTYYVFEENADVTGRTDN